MSESEEQIAKEILDAAYTVHKALEPDLLERVYEICFCREPTQRGLFYRSKVDVPIVYDGITFDECLRLDVLIEYLVICELKAVDVLNPLWEAQVLSHLKLTQKRLVLLINFNVPVIKDGLKRIIL